jgi:flagellar hook-basal body complex protein FliE
MTINNIQSIFVQPTKVVNQSPIISEEAKGTGDTRFGDYLKNAISEVNSAQIQSDAATEGFIKGDQIDLHEVMIVAQKASITMQTALEIRNKAVEAYQEIMRMQV